MLNYNCFSFDFTKNTQAPLLRHKTLQSYYFLMDCRNFFLFIYNNLCCKTDNVSAARLTATTMQGLSQLPRRAHRIFTERACPITAKGLARFRFTFLQIYTSFINSAERLNFAEVQPLFYELINILINRLYTFSVDNFYFLFLPQSDLISKFASDKVKEALNE